MQVGVLGASKRAKTLEWQHEVTRVGGVFPNPLGQEGLLVGLTRTRAAQYHSHMKAAKDKSKSNGDTEKLSVAARQETESQCGVLVRY